MKRIVLVTTLLSVFLLSSCNNPAPGPDPTPSSSVEFDFDPSSEASITINELESKEIKIKFKEDSYKENAASKTWTIDDKHKDHISKIGESTDGTSFNFIALKSTEEGDPAKLSITVTSKDGLATSTVSKTCSITINPHTHDKDSPWVSSDEAHWRHCHSCGQDFDYGNHVTYGYEGDDNYHWKECKICKKILNIEEHTPSPEIKYNETHHWHECTKCGAVLNKSKHTINPTNCKCDCGYHDPMFIVDKSGVLTGLTDFGKNYEQVLKKDDDQQKNDFSKAIIIEENAFKDCKASSIVIPSNVKIIHKNAFEGIPLANISYEEGPALIWHEYGNYKFKENLYETHVAMVNGMFYETLKLAIEEGVTQDNTIVKLIKPTEETDEISIDHNVYIEAFENTINLKVPFKVSVGKQIIFDKSISSKGNISLITKNDKEKCGNNPTEIDCINSGSVAFSDKPGEDVSVKYIDSSNSNLDKNAAGATQKYINEFGREVSLFAYGTLKFSLDYNTIVGLTEFGKTLNQLTISDFIEDRPTPSNLTIGDNAFNVLKTEEIEVTAEGTTKKISVEGLFQKGKFTSAIIGTGIKSIGEGAFAAKFERAGISPSQQEQIEKIVSKISSVEIGNSVKTIGLSAFKECYSLLYVRSSAGIGVEDNKLEEINQEAFYGCNRLLTVDLSKSINLKSIGKEAFKNCSHLDDFIISNKNGWMTEDGKYRFAAHELDSKTFAKIVTNAYSENAFKSLQTEDKHNGAIYIYHPDDVDEFGIHSNVINLTYIYEINDSDIYNKIKDGSILYITQKYFDNGYDSEDETKEITIHKNHSLYIKNETENNAKLHKITVEPSAYIILDEKIKVSYCINLSQRKADEIGGVAFTYHHKQPEGGSKENLVSIEFSGDSSVNAAHGKGFGSRVVFNGKEIEFCMVYGTYTFVIWYEEASYEKEFRHELRGLSTLGKMCKDLNLKHSVIYRDNAKIEVYPNISSHNKLVETLIVDRLVRFFGGEFPSSEHGNNGSFNDCPNLTTVKFVEGSVVKIINMYSFSNCPKLNTCDLSSCSQLELLWTGCFQNDTDLTKIALPDSNKSLRDIYKSSFRASGLKYFHMPVGLRNNWKAGSTKISPERLVDDANVAKLLTEDYVGKDWERR